MSAPAIATAVERALCVANSPAEADALPRYDAYLTAPDSHGPYTTTAPQSMLSASSSSQASPRKGPATDGALPGTSSCDPMSATPQGGASVTTEIGGLLHLVSACGADGRLTDGGESRTTAGSRCVSTTTVAKHLDSRTASAKASATEVELRKPDHAKIGPEREAKAPRSVSVFAPDTSAPVVAAIDCAPATAPPTAPVASLADGSMSVVSDSPPSRLRRRLEAQIRASDERQALRRELRDSERLRAAVVQNAARSAATDDHERIRRVPAVILALEDVCRYNDAAPHVRAALDVRAAATGGLRAFLPRKGRAPPPPMATTTTVFHSACVPPMSILHYVARLADAAFANDDVIAAAVVLAFRWQIATGVPITSLVVHRLLATCIIVAVKSLSDLFPSNDAFAAAAGLAADEMFGLEMGLLADLRFSVGVSWEEVATLQHLAVENKRTRTFADTPEDAAVVRGGRVSLCVASAVRPMGSFASVGV